MILMPGQGENLIGYWETRSDLGITPLFVDLIGSVAFFLAGIWQGSITWRSLPVKKTFLAQQVTGWASD